ncbi:uncharacterized protein G2W53_040290 [Senna tora]|uniref:Uncharacterized protein n=1 Tax=Senna tora TaxID=362788 RepID=A0A834W8R2_9FABA|nr:uncharacterized protein G2W53_040290 [Senna tora]
MLALFVRQKTGQKSGWKAAFPYAPERKSEKPKAKLRSGMELQKFNDIFTN